MSARRARWALVGVGGLAALFAGLILRDLRRPSATSPAARPATPAAVGPSDAGRARHVAAPVAARRAPGAFEGGGDGAAPRPGPQVRDHALDPTPSFQPPFGREVIRPAIDAVKPAVERCYDEASAHAEERRADKLVVRFTVTAARGEGRAAAPAIVSSSLDDGRFQDCVRAAVDGARFSVPEEASGERPVNIPFLLRRRASAPSR